MIRHSAAGVPSAPAPTRKRATVLDRLLRRRQPDAQQSVAAQRRQPLQRQRQMRAALVRRQGVDLVDDHRARGRQHRAAGFRAEQDVERLRRGDEDVRRPPAHARRARRAACRRCAPRCGSRHRAGRARAAPRGCRRAAPRGCAGCRSTAPSAARRRRPASRRASSPSRPWRTSPSIAARKAASVLPDPVGAAISDMAAGLDRRPGLRLRRRRRGEAAAEPGGDRRMKQRAQVGRDRSPCVKRQILQDRQWQRE